MINRIKSKGKGAGIYVTADYSTWAKIVSDTAVKGNLLSQNDIDLAFDTTGCGAVASVNICSTA
jgi:hypothetical protein